MRRAWLTFILLLAALTTTSAALADTASLIQQLQRADDYRVRTQAALALGASGDEVAVQPLCGALGDSNVSVRAAAAAALGKLGKPSGAGCLSRAIPRESSSSVKSAMEKSLALIGGGGDSGGGVGPGTRYYVAIQVTSRGTRSDVEALVRGVISSKLAASSGFAVAPRSESPGQGGQIVKSKNLKGFFLLATVEAPVYSGGSLTQVIRLSMFSYPDKSLKGETSQKLTQEDTRPNDRESENVLLKMCAENATANFQKVINTL
jgi:hypothetical protein